MSFNVASSFFAPSVHISMWTSLKNWEKRRWYWWKSVIDSSSLIRSRRHANSTPDCYIWIKRYSIAMSGVRKLILIQFVSQPRSQGFSPWERGWFVSTFFWDELLTDLASPRQGQVTSRLHVNRFEAIVQSYSVAQTTLVLCFDNR